MHAARPGTASGGRPQTARECFTVRVRTDKATLRCVLHSDRGQRTRARGGGSTPARMRIALPSAIRLLTRSLSLCVEATVSELRAAIALQSSIPVDRQSLTRERRHWFDAAAAPGTAPTHDDFIDETLSMQAAGIAHGDMLYVIEKPVRSHSSADSDAANGAATPAAAADDDEDEAAAEDAASAPPALQRNTSLVFRGWLADEVESATAVAAAQSTALASQSAATDLLQSIRASMRQFRGDPALDQQLEELNRLIPLCGPSAAWASSAASAAEAAAAKPALPAEQSPANSARARPSSSSRGSSRGASQNHELDDGGVSSGLGNSRPSSGSRSASAATAAASADPVAELTAQLDYWRGRYDRLRVKAEKMNAAGLSLQNSMDLAALQHEKSLLLMKGRLAKRDAKLALADRTIRAWQQRDRQEWGGDGTIELSPEDRQELTSLASAPSLRSTSRPQQPQQSSLHQPTPPRSIADAASSSAAVDAAPRRARPESAGRYRSSRPSSGDSVGHVAVAAGAAPSSAGAATGAYAPMHSPPPAVAASSPLVRPSSAGRSRRAISASAAGAAAAAPPSSAAPLSSDSWTSAAAAFALPPHQAEAVALQAAQAQQQLLTSRSQVRQAVDSAKQARAGLVGSRGSALVAGPYAREL